MSPRAVFVAGTVKLMVHVLQWHRELLSDKYFLFNLSVY